MTDHAPAATSHVAPAELSHRISAEPDLTVIDVRTPAEFAAAHIPGTHNVPLPELTEHAAELARTVSGPVVLMCASGARSRTAAEALTAAGHRQVGVLDGGITAYQNAGGEVAQAGNVWAMERQVRMAAGSLVLAGTVAGRLINPRLGLLAGAIGAGLTFSALTDTCGMARVLERMPWNRAESESALPDLLERRPETAV